MRRVEPCPGAGGGSKPARGYFAGGTVTASIAVPMSFGCSTAAALAAVAAAPLFLIVF